MAGPATLLFAGLDISPAREYVASLVDPARHQRWILPCVGRWSTATAIVTKHGHPERVEASDLCLFSSVIGYLADPRHTLDELQVRIPDDLAKFTAAAKDEYEQAAGILLTVKYLSTPAKTVHAQELRNEMWRNAHHIRGNLADGIREQVTLLAGCRYDVADVRDVINANTQNGGESDTFFYVNLPGYCLAPHHRILTADLRWRPAGELKSGDQILTFEEEARPGNKNRRWTEATILRSEPAIKECVKVTLADGTEVICSADHPWLTESVTNGNGLRRWTEAANLLGTGTVGRVGNRRGPQQALRLLTPWDDPTTWEQGWLAGIFDGEGHISAGSPTRGAPKLGVAQALGPTLDRIEAALEAVGLKWSKNISHRGRKPVANLTLNGGFNSVLRTLGSIRPERLIERLREQGYGDRQAVVIEKPRVIAVEPIGLHPVQSIETSSRTYIGEGFAMHNSGGYGKQYGNAETLIWTCRLIAEEFDPADARTWLDTMTTSPMFAAAYVHHGDDQAPADWTKLGAFASGPDRVDYIVANRDPGDRLVVRKGGTGQPKQWPVYADQEITPDSVITFELVDKDTCLHYRDLFVHRLGQTKAERYCLMLVDGRVTTAFGLHCRDVLLGKHGYAGEVFGISVTSARYARLGKLFMMALTSGDFRRWLITRFPTLQQTELSGIQTASPTINHEGKTDRGVLKLVKREPRPGGGFQLLYRGDFRDDTLPEVMRRWHADQAWICRPSWDGPRLPQPAAPQRRKKRKGRGASKQTTEERTNV